MFLMIMLVIYTFSIVFGRLYTAMHSFTDCAVGVAMGAAIWWGQTSWPGIPVSLSSSNPLHWLCSALWPNSVGDGGTSIIYIGKGLGAGEWMEGWVRRGGWEVPLILIPICLLAVNQHPQPVDDCPCFEDAIAFVSVVLGSLVGTWAMTYSGADPVGRSVIMPGSGWVYQLGEWVQVERTWTDVGVWWSVAVLKMVVGKESNLSSVFDIDLAPYRRPGYIRLAHRCQGSTSFDSSAYFPYPWPGFPSPSPKVLHTCNGLQEDA